MRKPLMSVITTTFQDNDNKSWQVRKMPAKILLIDDEPDMLVLLRTFIRESTPYKIEVTNNPVEAIELVKDSAFDLVITDLEMPVLNGIDVLKALRRINAEIPVIIMDSAGREDTIREAVQEGGVAYLIKPFRKKLLLLAIERALKLKNTRQEHIASAIS